MQNLIDRWNNPFVENQKVVGISTAKEARDDVRLDLLQAQSTDEEKYQKFKRENVMIHDPSKMKKLKTFFSLNKQKKRAGRAVILKADKTLFNRIMDHHGTKSKD